MNPRKDPLVQWVKGVGAWLEDELTVALNGMNERVVKLEDEVARIKRELEGRRE